MQNVKSLCIVLLALGLLLPAATRAGTVEGEIVSGLQWFADEDTPNSAKFEEYREDPNGFVAERFRLNWEASERFYLDLDAFDIAQDDQRVRLDFGNLDLWKIEIDWSENPHNFSDEARQIHAHQGGGVYTITSVTDIETFIEESAYEVDLGYQRETGAFTLEVTPVTELTLGIAASRERREGTLPTIGAGYPFGGVGAGGFEVAFPIDYTTDTATGYLEYAAEMFLIGGRYTWSEFDTEFDRYYWENPAIAEPDPSSVNQLDTGDDSEMRQWTVYAAGNLPGRTRISATASQGTIENDDRLLPHTINEGLAAGIAPEDVLAGQSLDGEYDTALYDLRLSGRPNRWFNWKAWWRQYEMERQGREYEIEYIAADDHVGELRRTLNFGYQRNNMGALLGFSPHERVDLGLEFERESWDRDNSPVSDADEDSWRLFLDVAASDWLNLRASYKRQEREADDYDYHYLEHESFPDGEAPGAVNIGSRRFIWADRDRDSASLSFEVTPAPAFSIYGEARWWESDYMDANTGQDIGTRWLHYEERTASDFGGLYPGEELYSLLLAGRSEDEGSSYTLGFSVNPNDNFRLFADYTWEQYDYTTWSRHRNPGGDDIVGVDAALETAWSDWFSDNEDEYRTISLGFQGTFPNGLWDVTGNFAYHEGQSSYGQQIADYGTRDAGDYDPFPTDTDTEMILAKLHFDYHARSNLSFGFGYWYERWEEDDWQFDYNEPYMGRDTQDPGSSGAGTAQFLGIDFQDYENHILVFNVRFLF